MWNLIVNKETVLAQEGGEIQSSKVVIGHTGQAAVCLRICFLLKTRNFITI